jgi:protocatechuate 3,4-dioxygenase beta subunit
MKKLGLFLLVTLLILGGVFVLNPAGDGDSGHFEGLDGGEQPGIQDASVGLSSDEGLVEAAEADQRAGAAGLAEAGRSSLEMGTGGEIRGQVLGPLSVPVAGARVLLYRSDDVGRLGEKAPIFARAVSDKEGRFRLAGLELLHFNLRVLAEGWVNSQTSVRLSGARPKHIGMIVRLREGHALAGVVVDPAGKPVEGAWVVVSWRRGWGAQNIWPEMRSDEQGRFVFRGIPRGKIHVLAWAEGHSLGMTEGDASESQDFRIELPKPGPFKMTFSLAEPSKEGGAKPTDVTAKLYFVASNATIAMPSPIRFLELPAEGEVSTRGLCEGSYQTHMESKSVHLKNQWRQQNLTKKKPTVSIKLSWSLAVGLAGKLVFKGGQPAAGIFLRVTGGSGVDQHSVKSDKEGRFEFAKRFQTGSQSWLTFLSPGFLFEAGDSKRAYARLNPGKKDNVLTILRTTIFAGRVVDSKGRPVPGAKVWLHPAASIHSVYGSTTTDEKGAFRLSATRTVTKPLILDANDHTSYCPSPLAVDKDAVQPQEGLLIHLVNGAWVEGNVVDDGGAGIAGVSVSATFIPPPKPKSARKRINNWRMNQPAQRRTTTNKDGRFRILGLAPGSWRVSARSTGRLKRTMDPTVQLVGGERRAGLRFVMAAGLSIEGRLLTDSGEPLVGASVSARYEGKLSKTDTGGRANAQTTKDGSFVLKGIRAGSFKLTAQLPWKLRKELGYNKRGPEGQSPMRPRTSYTTKVMAGIKDFRWQIGLPRFGELRARFAQSGSPLSRIQLQLRAKGRSWSFDLPVKQGVVSMKRVVAGTYDLTFRSSRFADQKLQVQVHADQVTDLGLLSLGDLPELDCRVVDEAGKGLAGVWVGLDRKLGNLWSEYELGRGPEQFQGRVLTQSDARGDFRVPSKGPLRIYAFKPGYAPGVLRHSPPRTSSKTSKGASNKAGAKGKREKPAAPLSKQPVLVLKRAAELSVIGPSAAKGTTTRWYAKLTLLQDSAQQGQKPKRGWSRSLRLKSSKPIRFVGLPSGRYRLEALDFNKGSKYQKKSVAGVSYYEELIVQTGTHRMIRIP